MKKIRLITVTLAAVILAVSAVYARSEGECRKHFEEPKGSVFKELNLTPEQEKKLEENRKAQGEEMIKIHAAIQEKQVKLQKELGSPGVTMGAIDPLVNEIKSLQARLIDRRIKGIFTAKAILTPEQFVKFQQMTKNWQEKKRALPEVARKIKGAD